jgi:hypothetical protein
MGFQIEKSREHTMSFHEIPLFDLLDNQDRPYPGFGEILPTAEEQDKTYNDSLRMAKNRVEDCMGVRLSSEESNVSILEHIISDMWKEGWDPSVGNINLFTTDFGLLLSDSIQMKVGGCLVFRSIKDLSHSSLWWPNQKYEVFPFHKVYKRLIQKEGESLLLFEKGILSLIPPVQ